MSEKIYEGVRVLDLTNNFAGPISTAMMTDYGAEVIHIEKPVLGDDVRQFPPLVQGVSMSHAGCNRGKKSLVLDLKDPRGVQVVKDLVKTSDVLVESNRPGVMKRLGLDYETLKEINPRLIYCSISAYGQVGPYAERPGYDIIAQAVSGFMEYTGERNGPPMKSSCEIGDWMGGLSAFGSIGTALYHREKTGHGQHVDISLVRNLLWACSGLLAYKVHGKKMRRSGNQHSTLCPYGVFNGNGDQNLVIATLSSKLWCELCDLMGVPEYGDNPRFVSTDMRVKNRALVIKIIETWLKTFEDISDAEKLLLEKGIPCAKVYDAADIVNDPHYKEAGWYADVPMPEQCTTLRELPLCYAPVTFSASAPEFSVAPDLGQNNRELLSEVGYSQEEADRLEAEWADNVKKGRKK